MAHPPRRSVRSTHEFRGAGRAHLAAPRRPAGNPLLAIVSPYTWLATIHLLSDVFIGAVTFTLVVTLLALSASLLAVALLGVPLWLLTVHIVRSAAAFERARFRLTLGMDVPAPPSPPRAGALRYAWRLLTDAAVWRQVAYCLVLLPWGIVAFVATAAHLVGAAGTDPDSRLRDPAVATIWLWRIDDLASASVVSLAGVVLLVGVAPNIVRMLSSSTRRWVAGSWAPTAPVSSSSGSASWSRAAGAWSTRRRPSAAASSATCTTGRSRRLVALAMTLGRAKARASDDDARGRQLVDEAHAEAKRPHRAARPARGLHPPVLSDRGLDAALSRARRPLAGAGRRRGRRRGASRPHRRGDCLLRRRGGAHQRREHSGARHASVRRARSRRDAAGRRPRRRHGRRRGPGGHRPAACATASPVSTAALHVDSPSGAPPCSPWRCHAGRDRRGLGAAPRGISRLLEDAGATVVDAVGDGEQLLRAVAEHEPDVCVVDVRMPPTYTDEGVRAALVVRKRWPSVAVLVLSQYVEEKYASELLAGDTRGVGYLLKDRVADVEEFVEALRRVAAGGAALDPEVVGQLLARSRRRDPLDALTPREVDVLRLMAEGRSNAGIAKQLVVTDGAVEKHVSSIFTKLDLAPGQTDHRRVLAVLRYLED
jgi:DNA-binding NarL/FixJ family response regulator